jgi:hypothetical protein
MLRPGDRAPEISLPDAGGTATTLETLLSGSKSLHLVFVRHLG